MFGSLMGKEGLTDEHERGQGSRSLRSQNAPQRGAACNRQGGGCHLYTCHGPARGPRVTHQFVQRQDFQNIHPQVPGYSWLEPGHL